MPRYRFRVKAVNKLGQSLPCDMKGGAIVIKVRMTATMILRMNFVQKNAVRSSCWSKATAGCICCRSPEICFRFGFFSSSVLPDHISTQVGVNVTRKIVECRYRSDGP